MALDFDATINDTQFEATIRRMENNIARMAGNVEKGSRQMDVSLGSIGKSLIGFAAFNELSQLPGKIVQVRGEFQQLEIALETMLGSKEKADKLFSEAVDLAAKTPFNLKEVGQGAKQLLAYGVASEEITGTLRRLGDVAAGLSIPLNDLTYLYGTTRTQGRLFTQDLNQFVGRGIPLISLLAEQFGVAESEVRGMVEAGRVGFPEVEKAINSMTDEGGKFFNLMEKQSGSLTGLMSNLGDAFDKALNDVGESNQGFLTDAIKGTITLTENYQKVIDIMAVLVAGYGAYKAVLIATSALQASPALLLSAKAFLQLAAGVRTATEAQVLFNVAFSANPIGLIVAALAAAAAAYYVFSDSMTEAEKAQQGVIEAGKKTTSAVAEEKAKIDLLINSIKDGNLTYGERQDKLKELIAIAPDVFGNLTQETLLTKEGTGAIENYVAALTKKIKLEKLNAAFLESVKRTNDISENGGDLSLLDNVAAFTLSGPFAKNFLKSRDAIRKLNEDKSLASEKKIQEEIFKEIGAINAVDAADAKATDKKITRHEEFVNKLKDARGPIDLINIAGLAKTEDEFEEVAKRIKEAKGKVEKDSKEYKKLVAALEKIEPKKAKAIPEKDKPQPFGSIAYYNQIAQKAEEILQKTASSDTKELERQNYIILEAKKRAAEIEKTFAIKTYEQELAEKRKQYERYQLFVEQLGKESADKQFEGLTAGAATYVDFLNNEIAKIGSKGQDQLLSTDLNNLLILKGQLNEITKAKTSFEVFQDSIQSTIEGAVTLTEALELLNAEKVKLDTAPNTPETFEKRLLVAEKTIETERARAAQLKEFLNSVTNFEEQRVQIAQKYGNLRVELDKQFADKTSKEYLSALAKIEKGESEAFKESKKQTLEESKAYKDLQKVILSVGGDAYRERITRLKAAAEQAREITGEQSEDYKQKLRELQDAQADFDGYVIQSIQRFAGIAGELSSVFEDFGGAVGEAWKVVGGIAGNLGDIFTAFDSGADKTEKVAAGVSGLVGLLKIVSSSAKERRRAEEEYYASVLEKQQQYNIALNEQIGLQNASKESVFLKDYEGRLTDGLNQYTDAVKKQGEALKELEKGRAKIGQKNGVDFNKVGQGIAAGAAAGAAIGTIIPGVGNIVGAVGGAIVGGFTALFGGKKKKDVFGGLFDVYPDLVKAGADGVAELNVELAKVLISTNQVDEATKALLQSAVDWQEQMIKAEEAIKSVVSELAGSLGNSLRDSLVNAFKEGEDAAVAFAGTVSSQLESILSQLLFNQVFSGAFKSLEQDLIDSYGAGGDASWIDDFGKFFAMSGELNDKFAKGLEEAQKAASAYGLDIFGPKEGKGKKGGDALTGAIKGASAEEVGVLIGQFNALRISSAQLVQQGVESLRYQARTATNTDRLESMENLLKVIASYDPGRSQGIPK